MPLTDYGKFATNVFFMARARIPGDPNYAQSRPALDFLNRLIAEFRALQTEEIPLVVDCSGMTHERIDWREFFSNPEALLPHDVISAHAPDAIAIKCARLAYHQLAGTLALRLDLWLQSDLPSRTRATEDLPGIVHFPWAFDQSDA